VGKLIRVRQLPLTVLFGACRELKLFVIVFFFVHVVSFGEETILHGCEIAPLVAFLSHELERFVGEPTDLLEVMLRMVHTGTLAVLLPLVNLEAEKSVTISSCLVVAII
jgi:hypothetical protein